MARSFGSRRPAGSFSAPGGASTSPVSWGGGSGRGPGGITVPGNGGASGPADGGSFFAAANVALSTAVDSNLITLANIGTGVALTITGGSYSKNGAAFATAATTVSDGDTLRLRVTSSASNATTTTVTATIGGSARSFSVTTAAAAPGNAVISGTLAAAIIGQPYDQSLIVTPPGSAITLDAATLSALTARSVAHDGFGRFTSAGVTA